MCELKAIELRSGNLFMNELGHLDTISAYYIHELEMFNNNPKYRSISKHFKPVVFNEELFLDLGFKKLNHLGMFVYVLYIDEWLNFEADLKHGTFHLVSGQENNDLNIDVGSYTVYRLIEIEFIHQLQNLYFALTGKELTHQKIN